MLASMPTTPLVLPNRQLFGRAPCTGATMALVQRCYRGGWCA